MRFLSALRPARESDDDSPQDVPELATPEAPGTDPRPGDTYIRQLLIENAQDSRAILREIVEATTDLRQELRRHRRTVYRRWVLRFTFGLVIGFWIGLMVGQLVAR